MNDVLEIPSPACQFTDPRCDGPVRGEMLGLERLESHARTLAVAGKQAAVEDGVPLLRHFAHIRAALLQAHQQLLEWAQHRGRPDGEAEWLLDNHHIVVDVLREIQTDMPADYYRLLPKLRSGPLTGFPRVYALALELIAHCDSSIDEAHMMCFVQAYQEVVPLTIGELWAVPSMLRLVLVDNLRRLAENAVQAHSHREHAQQLAGTVLAHQGAESQVDWSQLNTKSASWADPFILRLHEEFRDHGGAAEEEWLEKLIAGRAQP